MPWIIVNLTERKQRPARSAGHYDEPALAALLVQIGVINVFNRLNVSTRQVAGEWVKAAVNASGPSRQESAA